MVCVQCGKHFSVFYTRTIRWSDELSEWLDDGGFICSHPCSVIWSKGEGQDDTVKKDGI